MLKPLIEAAWAYRGFIRSSIANEFRARLARSRFGVAWIVIQPLAMVVIYAMILSNVLAAKLQGVDNRYAYAVYLVSGILCWSLFADIVQRCLTVFIDNGSLLRKIQFPRISLPLITIGSALVGHAALLVVVLGVIPFLGFMPNWSLLWIVPLTVVTVMLAAGFGVLLGVLNVFARDVGQVTAVAMQFWFWATPIVYPISIVPDAYRSVLAWNPVVSLVDAYHEVLVYGQAPSGDLWSVMAVALALVGGALFVFRRASTEMVDVL